MTVLDARALKDDPKGMAFLRSVLRQTSKSHSGNPPKPGQVLARFIKRRTAVAENGSTRP